jgi:flagellar basal-body rod modification protein FlgD
MPINIVQDNIFSDLGFNDPTRTNNTESNQLGQADFLRLMTQQLASQDPFKPMEDGEFIAQMAQFSSVDSLQRLESSFSDLSVALSSSQALQASTLVGNDVLVPADVAYLEDEGSVSGVVGGLTSPVTNATLSITDESGQVIRTINLGDLNSTESGWEWDGNDESGNRVDSGIYQIAINGKQNGENFQFQSLVAAQVESVSLGGAEGVVLNLLGLGPVALDDVSRIGGG